MAQEYTISAVSPKQNNWESAYGPMITYHVKLNGGEEVVQLNKKADSPQPTKGDTVYGDIQETEYGAKFKSVKKPFSSGGKFQPRDDAAIQAQWALGRSYEKHGATEEAVKDAQWLFNKIALIKGTKPVVTDTNTGYEKAKVVRSGLPEPAFDDDGNIKDQEPINLDDIPF